MRGLFKIISISISSSNSRWFGYTPSFKKFPNDWLLRVLFRDAYAYRGNTSWMIEVLQAMFTPIDCNERNYINYVYIYIHIHSYHVEFTTTWSVFWELICSTLDYSISFWAKADKFGNWVTNSFWPTINKIIDSKNRSKDTKYDRKICFRKIEYLKTGTPLVAATYR